jgi:hypothetical protein
MREKAFFRSTGRGRCEAAFIKACNIEYTVVSTAAGTWLYVRTVAWLVLSMSTRDCELVSLTTDATLSVSPAVEPVCAVRSCS